MKTTSMAFCPTMTPYAEAINAALEPVSLVPAGSAAAVLQMLRNQTVDSVLIGRVAKSSELGNDTGFKRLREGLTLVYREKTTVPEVQLREIRVRTYLTRSALANVAPFFHEIEYRDDINECMTDGLSIPVLIDWRDFRDEFELLIPVNAQGKVPEFRAPIVYYRSAADEGLFAGMREVVA